MAYSYQITHSMRQVPRFGRGSYKRYIILDIIETDARDTSEWNTNGTAGGTLIEKPGNEANRVQLFPIGTIRHYIGKPISGTGVPGATIQPIFGLATGDVTATLNLVAAQAAAATYINDMTPARYEFDTSVHEGLATFALFGRSRINSVVEDHVIHHRMVISEGHDV